MGDRQTDIPPFPLTNLVSKHSPSVRTSPTWGRRKSLICGMCSGPPRYYNLMNRQAGCSLILPPLRAARLFYCLRAGGSEPSGTGCRGEANFALHAFSETSLPIRKRSGKQHTSRKRTLTLSRFIGNSSGVGTNVFLQAQPCALQKERTRCESGTQSLRASV
jgi:hypothetical protein